MQTSVIYGLLIPFVGTSLGSACVFFLKKGLGDRVQRGLTGFASGVMVLEARLTGMTPGSMFRVLD